MKTLYVVFWLSIPGGSYTTECCNLTLEYLEKVLHELSIFDVDYSMENPSSQCREIFLSKLSINEDLIYILLDAREESERTEDLEDMFVIEELEDLLSDDCDDDGYDHSDGDDNYYDPLFDPNEQDGQNCLSGGTGQWSHE